MFPFVYRFSRVSHTEYKLCYPDPHLHSLDCHPLLHIALHNPLGWARPYKTYLLSASHLLLSLPLEAFTKQLELWSWEYFPLFCLDAFFLAISSAFFVSSEGWRAMISTMARWRRFRGVSGPEVTTMSFSSTPSTSLTHFSTLTAYLSIKLTHFIQLVWFMHSKHTHMVASFLRTMRPKLPHHTKFVFFTL